MRFLFLAPFLLLAVACSPSDFDDGDVGDFESSSEALSSSCALSRSKILASASSARRRAVERGFRWLDANVPYSQSRSYGSYRTDCSGFVSMCWELGTSYTTADFSTGGGESEKLASYDSLLPGDALVRRANGSGHIVLFLGWNDSAKRGACVLEQASTAEDMEFRVRTMASLRSSGYAAIRADKLRSDTSSPASSSSDDDDDGAGAAPAGEATDDEEVGTACTTDGQCNPGNDGSGKICSRGRCVSGCRSSAQCPGTTRCISGQCQ